VRKRCRTAPDGTGRRRSVNLAPLAMGSERRVSLPMPTMGVLHEKYIAPWEAAVLKINLLTTTALVLAASCAISQSGLAAREQSGNNGTAIQSPENPAVKSAPGFNLPVAMQMHLGKPGRNRNVQFLNTYGYKRYSVSSYLSSESHSIYLGWRVVATPIKGMGSKITRILVEDCPSANSSFTVGVYTNDHGAPGNVVASGLASAHSCGWTSATIPPTRLKAGKKYWVVESDPHTGSGFAYFNEVHWIARTTGNQHKALYRYHSAYSSFVLGNNSSYTSPWLQVSGPPPFVKVK